MHAWDEQMRDETEHEGPTGGIYRWITETNGLMGPTATVRIPARHVRVCILLPNDVSLPLRDRDMEMSWVEADRTKQKRSILQLRDKSRDASTGLKINVEAVGRSVSR